ncbi:MAG: hypothetical protein ACI9MB_003731, partial [Verrucomicrobiales bacterium]
EAIRYRELLLQCLPDREAQPEVLIDHSPATIHLIPSFLRIVPKGKIIVSIRDPRDVLVSSLFAHFAPERNTVALAHPFDAADKINSELGTWLHFRELLDPSQFIEVRYEELVADPSTEVAHICEFLEIDHDPSVILPNVHQDSVGRWQHYEEPLAAYYNELEPLIKPLGYE